MCADNPKLYAQVPAPVPPGAGQRHHAAGLLHLQDLRLQGVRLHRGHGLPEREGIIIALEVVDQVK